MRGEKNLLDAKTRQFPGGGLSSVLGSKISAIRSASSRPHVCVCEPLESTGYARAFSSAAGRGVVQVAAHERCVLVQRIIEGRKNLHSKKALTRLFGQLWPWRVK